MDGNYVVPMLILISAGLTHEEGFFTSCKTTGGAQQYKPAVLTFFLSTAPMNNNMYANVFTEDRGKVLELNYNESLGGLVLIYVAPGFEYAGCVGNKVTVLVRSAMRNMTGRYYVEDTYAHQQSQWGICFLKVEDEPASVTWTVAFTWTLLLLLVVLLSGLFIFVCFKLRKRKPMGTEFEELLPKAPSSPVVHDKISHETRDWSTQTEERAEDSKEDNNENDEAEHQQPDLRSNVKRHVKPKIPEPASDEQKGSSPCSQADAETDFELNSQTK